MRINRFDFRALCGLLLGLSNFAHGNPVPERVDIVDVTVNGKGCPQGSVEKNISHDRQSFVLTFRDFIAELSPRLALSESRSNCQITLQLQTPPGWRYAVSSIKHRGYLDLDQGVRAEHSTVYYFQGTGKNGEFHERMDGPDVRGFAIEHSVALVNTQWSSCQSQRALNINSVLRLTNTDPSRYPFAEGVLGTDSLDGYLHSQEWKLLWEKCP